MKLLTKEQWKLHENAIIFKINKLKIKNIEKLGTIVIIQGNIEALDIGYVM